MQPELWEIVVRNMKDRPDTSRHNETRLLAALVARSYEWIPIMCNYILTLADKVCGAALGSAIRCSVYKWLIPAFAHYLIAGTRHGGSNLCLICYKCLTEYKPISECNECTAQNLNHHIDLHATGQNYLDLPDPIFIYVNGTDLYGTRN